MAYTFDKWSRRVKYRSDLSGHLYHLTKKVTDKEGKTIMTATEVLIKIIKERKLIGSSTEKGFIVGERKAVCFQDTPIYSLTQNIVHENAFREELGGKVRYVSVGLAFSKPYIFNHGGRPVFYESTEKGKRILQDTDWWRIVDFDLSDKNNIVDWTHEREWRIPVEESFDFDLSKATIVVPNQASYVKLLEGLPLEDIKSVLGIVQTSLLIY